MTPMNTDLEPICGKHDELTRRIIGVFYAVYSELGWGFVESVYSGAMRVALSEAGMMVQLEVPIPVSFRGHLAGLFKADMIVNGSVLVELKACDALIRQHESQVLNYLRGTTVEVALLMNFGPMPRFKRLVLDNDKKKQANRSVESVLIGAKSSTSHEAPL